MTTFQDLEHGFEAKFAHDEELKFRATPRPDGSAQTLGVSVRRDVEKE